MDTLPRSAMLRRMEMPTVNENHHKLEALAGTWTGDETIHPSPWNPNGGPAVGAFENRLDLDGFFLINDYVETRDGQVTYRGHGVYGWDDKESCYTMYWFDSMGGGGYAIPARGTWEGDTLTFEHKTPLSYVRYIYKVGDGVFDFRIDNSKDGVEWTTFMDGHYVRS